MDEKIIHPKNSQLKFICIPDFVPLLDHFLERQMEWEKES